MSQQDDPVTRRILAPVKSKDDLHEKFERDAAEYRNATTNNDRCFAMSNWVRHAAQYFEATDPVIRDRDWTAIARTLVAALAYRGKGERVALFMDIDEYGTKRLDKAKRYGNRPISDADNLARARYVVAVDVQFYTKISLTDAADFVMSEVNAWPYPIVPLHPNSSQQLLNWRRNYSTYSPHAQELRAACRAKCPQTQDPVIAMEIARRIVHEQLAHGFELPSSRSAGNPRRRCLT